MKKFSAYFAQCIWLLIHIFCISIIVLLANYIYQIEIYIHQYEGIHQILKQDIDDTAGLIVVTVLFLLSYNICILYSKLGLDN